MSQGLGISFLFNILNGDLYIDAVITELFQICLVVSQTLGEGAILNVFKCIVREVGEFLQPGGQVNSLANRFALWDQWQEKTMYGALSQLSYFQDLEEEMGDALKPSLEMATQVTKDGEGGFHLSQCDTAIFNFYYQCYWVL